MKFLHQVGLVLLVNLTIVSGGMLPGMARESVDSTDKKTAETKVMIAEVVVEGVPDNLKEVVFKTIVTKAGAIITRSQLQSDINAIFATGWFKEIMAIPSDTAKGVQVTFKIVPNQILRRINVKPKNKKLFIPQSVIDEIFGTQYGKIVNSINLEDGMGRLLRWCRKYDKDYGLLQIRISKDTGNDGVINLEFSEISYNFTGTVTMTVPDYIALGKSSEEIGKLDDALAIYKKAATLLDFNSPTSGQSRIVDDRPQSQIQPPPVGLAIIADYYKESAQHDRAIAYRMVGNVLKKKKQFVEADIAYRQAELIEADLKQARQAVQEADKLLAKGDPDSLRQAIVGLKQTLQLSEQNRIRSLQALTLDRLGRAYEALGEHQKALDLYNQALPIVRFGTDQSGDVTMLTLAEKQKALGESIENLRKFRLEGIEYAEAQTLDTIGSIYHTLGENQKALDFYNQALSINREMNLKYRIADVLLNIGDVYNDLGDSTKALSFYNESLGVIKSDRNQSIEVTAFERSREATLFNNIGSIYSSLGDKKSALDFYNKALLMNRSSKNPMGEATTLNNIGAVYSGLGEKRKALEFYNQSLAIKRVMANRLSEANTLSNIGLIYNDLGESQIAFDFLNQALRINRATANRLSEANTLRNLTHLYARQNKLTDALQNINAAIQIIESVRSELTNDVLKTSYFTSVQGYYQLKTDILMQLHQQQPTQGYAAAAIENTDQSRARVLRELLVQANANINKDVSPELLKQEQSLNQTLNAKEKQLVQLTSQPGKETELAPLNQAIAALYAQRDDLKNTIRATNPAYANLQYPKPITLAQIQQQLDPDTLMLQYSLGEQESYLWVIGQNTLKTYILPKRSDIEKTASNFSKEVAAKLPAPNSANQLTQQILVPAAADLGNKRLVIIPDGILHTIPFAALNTPNSQTYRPLITQHEITNLPSASTIGILRSTVATKPRGSKTLAILADPIFGKNDDRLTGKTIQANNNLDLGEQAARGRVGRDLDLNRLPFTATEAKGILALVPNQDSTAAFGFDASYDWITSPKISQYRYVHLATHGFFDNDKPALSSIVLSSFDAEGRDRKAYLRFPELFNLNLPSELVVLSACETGLGKNVPGEGLVGMTRGLMYAGALRVAVSLWSVDDQATSDLMQDFYKNLWQSQQSHAASLRAAQLTAWKQGKAPFYWAAFTLQGEWRN